MPQWHSIRDVAFARRAFLSDVTRVPRKIYSSVTRGDGKRNSRVAAIAAIAAIRDQRMLNRLCRQAIAGESSRAGKSPFFPPFGECRGKKGQPIVGDRNEAICE